MRAPPGRRAASKRARRPPREPRVWLLPDLSVTCQAGARGTGPAPTSGLCAAIRPSPQTSHRRNSHYRTDSSDPAEPRSLFGWGVRRR